MFGTKTSLQLIGLCIVLSCRRRVVITALQCIQTSQNHRNIPVLSSNEGRAFCNGQQRNTSAFCRRRHGVHGIATAVYWRLGHKAALTSGIPDATMRERHAANSRHSEITTSCSVMLLTYTNRNQNLPLCNIFFGPYIIKTCLGPSGPPLGQTSILSSEVYTHVRRT
jgi:hypothetical protein